MLGLVNTQSDELEDKEVLLKRPEEANKHVDPKQICIATQYVEEGQWRKLDLVHELVKSLNA